MSRPPLREERRHEILAAFEACILRKGLAATTLNDVALEAGLPRPLIRYFIGNRDEMISHLVERTVAREYRKIKAWASKDLSEKSPAALTEFLFGEFITDCVTDGVTVELVQASISDERLRFKLAQVFQNFLDSVARHLSVDPSLSTDERAFDIAFSVISLILGFVFFGRFGLKPNDPKWIHRGALEIIRSPQAQ